MVDCKGIHMKIVLPLNSIWVNKLDLRMHMYSRSNVDWTKLIFMNLRTAISLTRKKIAISLHMQLYGIYGISEWIPIDH